MNYQQVITTAAHGQHLDLDDIAVAQVDQFTNTVTLITHDGRKFKAAIVEQPEEPPRLKAIKRTGKREL